MLLWWGRKEYALTLKVQFTNKTVFGNISKFDFYLFWEFGYLVLYLEFWFKAISFIGKILYDWFSFFVLIYINFEIEIIRLKLIRLGLANNEIFFFFLKGLTTRINIIFPYIFFLNIFFVASPMSLIKIVITHKFESLEME